MACNNNREATNETEKYCICRAHRLYCRRHRDRLGCAQRSESQEESRCCAPEIGDLLDRSCAGLRDARQLEVHLRQRLLRRQRRRQGGVAEGLPGQEGDEGQERRQKESQEGQESQEGGEEIIRSPQDRKAKTGRAAASQRPVFVLRQIARRIISGAAESAAAPQAAPWSTADRGTSTSPRRRRRRRDPPSC